ncbi:SEL1-like repeat protein [Sinorhizobium medicae]|nr:sel1 repeat family protein [Sinorhizobium medicae]
MNGLSKLGKEGNLEAAAALGEFYFRQEHPLTYKLSFEWNEWAARRGDAGSQGRLATIYHEGLGVERNPQRAFAFWLLAAKQGHSGARAMSG